MSIHYLLKAGRRESGYTLREASVLLDLSPSTLYRYEEGFIARIPPERLSQLLIFYSPYWEKMLERLLARHFQLGWYRSSLLKPQVTAEYLYTHYLAADGRGRQAILQLMLWESLYSRGALSSEPKQKS